MSILKHWAATLHGREIGNELSRHDEEAAKSDGVIIVYGASDDLCEVRGAIEEEIGCYNGGEFWINPNGILTGHKCDCEYCGYKKAVNDSKKILILWGEDDVSWQYRTEIPHETFDIMEDGEVYCRGIVFLLESLANN